MYLVIAQLVLGLIELFKILPRKIVYVIYLHILFFMEEIFISARRRKKFIYKCGDKFGRLTLTGKTYTRIIYGHWVRYVEAVCECGDVKDYIFYSISVGDTKS